MTIRLTKQLHKLDYNIYAHSFTGSLHKATTENCAKKSMQRARDKSCKCQNAKFTWYSCNKTAIFITEEVNSNTETSTVYNNFMHGKNTNHDACRNQATANDDLQMTQTQVSKMGRKQKCMFVWTMMTNSGLFVMQ